MSHNQTFDSSTTLSTNTTNTSLKFSRRRSIVREFSLNTSAHGIPGIARSDSWLNRCFWSFTFILFTGIMTYFIVESIRAYFAYPTQTSVTTIAPWPQYFPAFTFCNLCPIRYDRFIESFLNYKNQTFYPNMTDPDDFLENEVPKARRFLQTKINSNEEISPYFFPLSSMLVKCRYNGLECSSEDFLTFTSSTYGNCFIFNSKMKNVPEGGIRYSHENGGRGTLSLQLYVHSHQYLPYFAEGTGIISTVHDNSELPRIEVSGMELVPGFRHRLTYRGRIDTLEPAPYSTCTEDIPLSMQVMYEHYQGADFAYSERICMATCTQVHNYAKCGCINPNQWDARRVVLPDTDKVILAPLCNNSDPCFNEATALLMGDDDLLNKYCWMCTEKCALTYFHIRSSMSKTPPKWLLNSIKKFVEQNSSVPLPSNWSTDWKRYIDENYLSVELIRETPSVESYAQEPTLSFLDVIANIGGHTGLWIGISFLSLMEFAEMLYRLVRHQFHLMRNGIAGQEKKAKIFCCFV